MKDLRDHYTLPWAYIKIIYVSLKNLQKDTLTFYRNFLGIILDCWYMFSNKWQS